MDQNAFRQLLTSSRQLQPGGRQAVPFIVKPQNTTTSTSSGPAFKPRKVKKAESRYRNRAAERREGTGNDYADVEAILEDFENRATRGDRDIEEQRKYLGGDSQHTILVRGLDMSLLEQNRARAPAATEDDEILEQAFEEATSIPETTEPRKRTREDIVRDLKAKRQNGDGKAVEKSAEDALEVAKMSGKFRPIGFKPIGQTKEKSKKRGGRNEKEGVKKKRKVEFAPAPDVPVPSLTNDTLVDEILQERGTTGPSSSKMLQKNPEPESGPLNEDFDIFADVGDYEGFLDEEESEDEHHGAEKLKAESATQEVVGAKGWFSEPEPEIRQASTQPEKSPPVPETEEEPQEIRLKPLESSTLPSIRDFLAMDEAVEKAEKRKARKEKKKKKKTGDDDD